MKKHPAVGHDQEAPQPPSRSSRQAKVVLIKKDNKQPTKKSSRTKAATNTTAAVEDPLLMKSPSTDNEVEARIAQRAYELYHRRGGHHGQDLEDWLTAEREVTSEESCCS